MSKKKRNSNCPTAIQEALPLTGWLVDHQTLGGVHPGEGCFLGAQTWLLAIASGMVMSRKFLSQEDATLGGEAIPPGLGEQAIAHVCFLILSGNPRIFSEVLHLDSQQVQGLTQTFYKALGKPNVDLFPKRKLKLLSSEVRPFQSKMFESFIL